MLYKADPVWGTFGTIVEMAPDYTLSVSPASLNFAASGEQNTFSVTSNTDWAVSSNVSWLTVSPASGSNNGTVTVTSAANAGTSQRTAMLTVSGSGVTAQTINITQDAIPTTPVTSVVLNYSNAELTVGETLQLTATVFPSNATNKTVIWSSSNPAVADVDANGKVSALSAGSATVVVMTADGSKTAVCSVTVSGSGTSLNNVRNTSFYATVINNKIRIESPDRELITIYSVKGAELYSTMKNSGSIEIPVSSLHGSVFIIKGSVSGTVKIRL